MRLWTQDGYMKHRGHIVSLKTNIFLCFIFIAGETMSIKWFCHLSALGGCHRHHRSHPSLARSISLYVSNTTSINQFNDLMDGSHHVSHLITNLDWLHLPVFSLLLSISRSHSRLMYSELIHLVVASHA